MRWLVVFSFLLLARLPLSAEDWTTTDGTVYKDVAVVQVADDGVTITYTGGTIKLPYYNLPLEIQKQYGHDPDTLEANRKAAAAAASATQAAAVETQKHLLEEKKQQAADAAQVKALAAARAALSPAPPEDASGIRTQVGDKASFPGTEYSYDAYQDISYLDSAPATASPLPTPLDATAEHTCLTLRVETLGSRPEHPDKITATILSFNSAWKLSGSRDIFFLVDRASMPIPLSQLKDTGFFPGSGQVVEFISFYLTTDQAAAIAGGKSVKFSVGTNNYSLDTMGIAKMQRYLAVIDQLPVPAPMVVRQYEHMVNTLPSLPMMISKVCEFIIIGSFSLLVLLGLAGCFLAAARFLKL